MCTKAEIRANTFEYALFSWEGTYTDPDQDKIVTVSGINLVKTKPKVWSVTKLTKTIGKEYGPSFKFTKIINLTIT